MTGFVRTICCLLAVLCLLSGCGARDADTVPATSETSAPIPAPAPTPETDLYVPEAVLDAWHTGDDSALSAKNKSILDAVRAVTGDLITEDMSDYDRELAIHDWMTARGQYDPAMLSHDSSGVPDPDNDNPYGFLLHGKGVCLGYASTFQLFMDCLGIECITVYGLSRGVNDHAWNMVRLDGDWYCVDVTWDDPVTAGRNHKYFNVTSEFMRQTKHQWDEQNVPEATAAALSRAG